MWLEWHNISVDTVIAYVAVIDLQKVSHNEHHDHSGKQFELAALQVHRYVPLSCLKAR